MKFFTSVDKVIIGADEKWVGRGMANPQCGVPGRAPVRRVSLGLSKRVHFGIVIGMMVSWVYVSYRVHSERCQVGVTNGKMTLAKTRMSGRRGCKPPELRRGQCLTVNGGAARMRLRSMLLAFAGCVLILAGNPGAARSQPIQGFYLDGGAGLRIAFPPKVTSLEPGVPGTFELRQDLGYATQFSAGYALGDGWRFELEASVGRSSISSVATTPYPATPSGSVQNLGIMTNALFDLDVRSPYVYPYLGVGLGYQRTRLDGFVNTPVGRPGSFSASGSSGAPAAQIIGGLSFPVPNMPGLSLTVDYRVMDILGGGHYDGASSIGLPAGSVPRAGAVKLHNQFVQNVLFGVRYAFNTPPPAAVTSQATDVPMAAAQSYEVAFEPNATTLSGRDQAVLRDAALTSTRQRVTRIAVTGSGDASRGAALSARRANTVIAALVSDGVPRELIAVRDAGDPTGSQDARVEIVTR
jgi:OmpA-OmpF porin, OOP family